MTTTYARRLGTHHFAYLRAHVEGLSQDEAARRYLGLEHGHELVTLHRQLVDQLRALARRAGDSRWRLIGLELGSRSSPASAPKPSLYEWAEAEGLGDWSEEELLGMYAERFPASDPREARRARRNGRMRERQLEVIAELEKQAGQPAKPTDRIDAWFDAVTAERLKDVGCLLLKDLMERIASRKEWWSGVRAIGAAKAKRIEAHLRVLLPDTVQLDRLASLASTSGGTGLLPAALPRVRHPLDGSQGANRSPLPPRVDAVTDLEAVDAWLTASVGRLGEPGHNRVTESTYRREAERWVMFCAFERGKAMSSANADDCRAFMAFLNAVPQRWISRRKATRLDVAGGWTPFRSQPSLASRRLAVKVLHLMHNWLVDQRYLDSNPWAAVNRRLVDGDEVAPAPSSRALTRQAYATLMASLPNPAQPGATRNGFVVVFTRHTGLRATELLNARIGDLKKRDFGWQLDVVGKGRKRRQVSVPSPALEVLEQALAARGLESIASCAADTPLLWANDNPRRVPTYAAVRESLGLFMRKAILASSLPLGERERALQATQHWLRHTFVTRALEAGAPMDVVMAEAGHSSQATTEAYSVAQEQRRHEAMERAAAAS